MATALRWQVDYASHKVHAGENYTRNIGIVSDFLALYRFTGEPDYLQQALRLFRDLRGCLSEGDLFTESGKPIENDPPFIDDDKVGPLHPYAKPYIIGYALQGLPELARLRPDEPQLVDVVRAVARFLAGSVDPVGGWRYPHPKSRTLLASMAPEHAMQITRAAAYLESRGEVIGDLLDATECVLQSRILVWDKTGQIFGGVEPWENAAGLLGEGKTVYDLYKKPSDRDPGRDYTEGQVGLGSAPPEGIFHFFEALDFYLAHWRAEHLLNANPALAAVLNRIERVEGRTGPR